MYSKEQLLSGTRRIVRVKVPFRYVRICVGHDDWGNSTRSHYTSLFDWHWRVTGKLFVCCGSY